MILISKIIGFVFFISSKSISSLVSTPSPFTFTFTTYLYTYFLTFNSYSYSLQTSLF